MTDYKFEAGKTYNLRSGGIAEILKVDANLLGGQSIIGIITYLSAARVSTTWNADGKHRDNRLLDLLPPEPERVSVWMNVYPSNTDSLCRQYDSRDFADMCASENRTHVLELIYNEDGEPVDVKIHKVER